jgi:heterodisulfide reductase subunit A
MDTKVNIGVFLCKCGDKIASRVDLSALEKMVTSEKKVTHCEIMPYPCMKPGLEKIIKSVSQKGINRIIIAGCEGRLMLKKLETELEPLGLHKGQIDMINIRGHVATVSDLPPDLKAEKSSKLIKAAVAEMDILAPSNQALAHIEGPTMIIGGGIASFMAAHELGKDNRDCFVSVETNDPEKIIRHLHFRYPGEQNHHKRLRKIIQETNKNPHIKFLPQGELTSLSGVTGDYTLTFSHSGDESPVEYKAGAIIACMDAELSPPPPGFGYDGKTVLYQPEQEEQMWQGDVPKGNVVFWINDYEAGYPEFAQLSTRSAWAQAQQIRDRSDQAKITMLFNENMPIPLSAAERTISRKLGIIWIPYDKSVYPTLQDGFISFCNLSDHVEHEICWDLVVLSPQRSLGQMEKRTAQILGLLHSENKFLSGHHARVRPDMVGREETYLAGSARYPGDLHESLSQGRKAGNKTVDMLQKAEANELFLPRVVCVVDINKCVGCGQCQEICDCGGIGVVEGSGGGLPRIVDPMICMGGGTCAAACPYNALTLQNNTTDQREARVASLSKQLRPDEVVALACTWGGLPAADNAAHKGLKYDPRVHILGVPCVGQIDPSVLARAFLEGAPGMILIGCLPEECHHSFGLDHAWSRVNLVKKLLTICGFDRQRIALAHADLNQPEEFIRTSESFTQTIASLGPIERSAFNISKLKSLYYMTKYNSRIRFLLSASLRRPWEDSYRGDQRHGLDYDQDFTDVLMEEFLQTRVLQLLQVENRPFKSMELADILNENEGDISERLWDMAHEGVVSRTFKNREVFYELG